MISQALQPPASAGALASQGSGTDRCPPAQGKRRQAPAWARAKMAR